MTDAVAFIAAIHAAPDDAAPRLVYADWLDDNGEAGLADLIRRMCRVPTYEFKWSRRAQHGRHAHAESIGAIRGLRGRVETVFDVFVSYSHNNKTEVDDLVKELWSRRPNLRVFVDRLELRPGTAWQQHIFESTDQSRKVICAFSPDYLASKICKEEFNIALFRHRDATDGVLLPLCLYSAELPTYMKLLHYEDVREGNRAKIVQSSKNLLKNL